MNRGLTGCLHFLKEGAQVCVYLGGQPRAERVERSLATIHLPRLYSELDNGWVLAVFAVLKKPTDFLAKRVVYNFGLSQRPRRGTRTRLGEGEFVADRGSKLYDLVVDVLNGL